MKKKTNIETKAPEPISVSTERSEALKPIATRYQINWYWVLMGGGIGSLILSFIIGSYWFTNPPNTFVGLLVVVLLAAGIVLVRRQIKHRHDRGSKTPAVVVNVDMAAGDLGDVKVAQKVSGNGLVPNSLCIYASYDEDVGAVVPRGVVFQHVDNPMGQPQRCINLGKDFYVHIFDIDKQKLVPFVLPDRKFTDPMILARYLGLPAQRKYLRNRDSLLKYVGPGLLLIGVIGGFIAIIALSGG